jgi:hypothetical protein
MSFSPNPSPKYNAPKYTERVLQQTLHGITESESSATGLLRRENQEVEESSDADDHQQWHQRFMHQEYVKIEEMTMTVEQWGHQLRLAAGAGSLQRVRRLHRRGGSCAEHINDADANGWQVGALCMCDVPSDTYVQNKR